MMDNAHVTATDPSHDWDSSYTGTSPPWDIGRPQPAFVHLAGAGALTGALLDAVLAALASTMIGAARHGATSLGIDVSPRAIEIAQRKAAASGVETTFQVFDVLRLDTLGNTFDTILDSGLFHVFDDLARTRYVTALHAVLRPGGHLHLMCFSDREPGEAGTPPVSLTMSCAPRSDPAGASNRS